MLSKVVRHSFSNFNSAPKGGFNLVAGLNRLGESIKAPIKHVKRAIEPSAVNYSVMTNTTEEGFDEVAHEWQALVTSNPFDVQVFNYLENVQATNFGTIDNPLVIFTSDTPFRYVGCTGQMNEDDYEGHELLFLMLREGPLQRCPQCGQVFKLVRLRNEYSPEMDYYISNFHPYEQIEMGEHDTTHLMSAFKYGSHYEYTQFEVPSNNVYSNINPDEHDRLLVDPAFRLEKTKALEEKLKVYLYSLQTVEKKFIENYGPLGQLPQNKVDYETLIEVEKSIDKMDRLFRKVSKFQNRKMIDRENHERREQRMLERQADRWDSNYTLFLNGRTEEEQQYLDYFQTDIENYPEDEQIEQRLDQEAILGRGDYNLTNFDFQEKFTRNPEDDQTSLVEKLSFQFRYRQGKDTTAQYVQRQNRMIERQIKRFNEQKVGGLIEEYTNCLNNNDPAAVVAETQLLDFLANESVQQIRDYFEDDKTVDLSVLNNLSNRERVVLAQNFENHAIPNFDRGQAIQIAKRSTNQSQGFWTNFALDMAEISSIAPRAKTLANNSAASASLPLTAEELKQIDQVAKLSQPK